MRSVLSLLVAVILFASHAAIAGPQEEVSARLDQWAKAVAAGSGKAVAEFYAADARLWGPFSKTQSVGTQEIANHFAEGLENYKTREFTFREHAIRVFGAAAVVSGIYDFRFTRPDGIAGLIPIRFSMALSKVGDMWLIVDHHASPLPQQGQH